MTEQVPSNPTPSSPKPEQTPQSHVISKIRKERVSNNELEYLVLYEGSDDKNGTWVKASTVTDPKLLAAFEKLKVQREKQKQHRLEKKAEKEKEASEKQAQEEGQEHKPEESKLVQAKLVLPPANQQAPQPGLRPTVPSFLKKKVKPKLEAIYGIESVSNKEIIFLIKKVDGPIERKPLSELKSEYPFELIDFLTKNIELTKEE
ncbi:hypothetical protein TVAG_168910 [Trichomonas vaginalis G3]|uniref:Chromo domain-containing protein n=1 Tax=Trichomonas vaginalis (strain ATCC PRA-98 / G3) TaxID=412133 RepID=A2EWQ9_TRIV3|nr:hypothetical protein TVAGG3_0211430 [Trichomonas vaginalis G3]EAY02889.1 hypothetical protein TVAG_168910 [Trichomonas vaginalis G3]KAI5551254.1 hypothetical protein TVAGG3_0211430 [Trichomonas vaginalis G3]|eukprot:XP_001315112.1 hypothetical protein [Trichomonas vaginalis G3]